MKSEYYARLKELNDRRAEASVNYDRGFEKGAEKERESSARRMIDDGLSDELVSKYSGLSVEEVGRLRC